MVENVIPKVFISYSWTKSDLVLQVANRLMSHGIEVVLDKWDLKEGQDKYVFMEQCVNNSDITKVLIFCDKTYTEKPTIGRVVLAMKRLLFQAKCMEK